MSTTSSPVTFGLVLAIIVLALPVLAAWRKGLQPGWLAFMAAATIALTVAMVHSQKVNAFAFGSPIMMVMPMMSPDMPSLMGEGMPQIDPAEILKQLQP